MTQEELNDDPIISVITGGGHVDPPGGPEKEVVRVNLVLSKEHWDEALTNGTQSKVLLQWIESNRV